MNLTKNQIYIISAVVIITVVYFMFFKKKTVVVVAPPAPKPGESNYFGEDWGWGSGPQQITRAEALYSLSNPAGNSVAGLMESGFDPTTGLVDNGRFGANAFPSNSISQKAGMFGKLYSSPNAGPSPQMNNPWRVGESNFAGSWLK
jgi:hypothetical protein